MIRWALPNPSPGWSVDFGVGEAAVERALGERSGRTVGLDHQALPLRRAQRTAAGANIDLLRADVRALPLRTGCARTGLMIRLYHRLDDPDLVLAEIARVLSPGGRLVVSFHPRPSWRTLAQDLWVALRQGARRYPSLTFSRTPVVRVAWSELPGRLEPYGTTRQRFARAGFAVRGEWGVGLEEIPLLRRLGHAVLLRVSRARRRIPWTPTVVWSLERLAPPAAEGLR